MRSSKPLVYLVVCIFISVLAACGGGGSGSETATGSLTVSLTDASTAKYLAVYVTIDEVQVNRNNTGTPGNSGWSTIAAPRETYNLLELVNGLTAVLGGGELTVGTYHQVRLIIGKKAQSENNILGVPHPYANYVILNDGTDKAEQLKIPSGFQTGLKLVHNFQVLENQTIELVLDFDACRSVVETGNGKFILKPTIKVMQTENKTAVFGEVTDDAAAPVPISGALVSAQVSEGFSSRVERSTLTSDDAGYEGAYRLLLSPGQDYSIVAFSDEKVGAPGAEEMYAPACTNLTVPAGADTEINFALAKSGFGTISGDVRVFDIIDSDNPPVVYVSFYAELSCGYVEVVSLPMSPDPAGIFSYSVDLPLGTYDVVAASEGYDPDTVAGVSPGGTADLTVIPVIP